MKSLLSRRVSAAAVTAVLLFVCIFSMSFFANAASAFSPRLSAPASTNSYYYSDKNIFYKYGYGMPNCTAYAFGRAYELLKSEPKLCHFNADEWYDYNITNNYYKYGKTPKLGAIACWTYSGGGHVAVVEKIENGTITFSNSGWNYSNFYLTTAKTSDPNAGEKNWNFQGYIYIGDFDSETVSTTSPKNYTEGVYKTNVSTTLNMRSGAGTSFGYVTSVPNNAKLTVTKIKVNEGYTWGYTTYNGKTGWVALDYCVYISSLPENEMTTAKPVQPTTSKPTVQPSTAQPSTAKPTVQPTSAPQTTVSNGLGVGDVNYDGRIDIKDATEIQKYIVEQAVFTEEQVKFADFDFSGKVDIFDVTCMQKYLVS